MLQFQKCQKLRQFESKMALCSMILFSCWNVFAVSTSTLPTGIYSPAFRYGQIGGIDQRYTESGSLVRLNDYKSIEFDAKTLAKFNSQAQNLISTLNRFGAFGLGDSFNLGTLEFQTKPDLKYFAPVLAYGITNKWTVGVGLPVVNYKNDVRLAQSFSNIQYYRSQFSGLSQDLDTALNTNIGQATQDTLVAKGYRPLENKNEQFLADAQVVSVFRLLADSKQTIVHQASLNLPTGPKYNADDLMALNSFHKTALENTFGYSRRVGAHFRIVPYTSIKLALPDHIVARIPKDEDDMLPDQNSKERVQRFEAATLELGIQSVVDFVESMNLSIDYKTGMKGEDRFSGSEGRRYDLLAKNTSSRWQKVSADFTYSTVKAYFAKKSLLPMMLSLSIYDTISGTNIERRTGQELATTFFF